MDKTSAVITSAAGAAAVFIAPLMLWILNAKLSLGAPSEVVYVISVLIVGAAHLACNLYNGRAPKTPVGENP